MAVFLTIAWNADAMTKAERAHIDALLSQIKTAAGGTAKERIARCGIKIRPESYAEVLSSDVPKIAGQRGDVDMELMVDLPRPPWFDPATGSDQSYKEMLMRWVFHNGKAIPSSAWSTSLQNQPFPLRSNAYLNC